VQGGGDRGVRESGAARGALILAAQAKTADPCLRPSAREFIAAPRLRRCTARRSRPGPSRRGVRKKGSRPARIPRAPGSAYDAAFYRDRGEGRTGAPPRRLTGPSWQAYPLDFECSPGTSAEGDPGVERLPGPRDGGPLVPAAMPAAAALHGICRLPARRGPWLEMTEAERFAPVRRAGRHRSGIGGSAWSRASRTEAPQVPALPAGPEVARREAGTSGTVMPTSSASRRVPSAGGRGRIRLRRDSQRIGAPKRGRLRLGGAPRGPCARGVRVLPPAGLDHEWVRVPDLQR